VQGPDNTIIGDNNQLAVALLMALPLAQYLRSQSANTWITRLLAAGMLLTIIAVLGTYSRGAVVGLGVLAVIALIRARRRLRYILAAAAIGAFALAFMPEQFIARMQTIDATSQDASFQGRVEAWNVAWMYARDHFPFGAGFYGPQLEPLFHSYYPGQQLHAAHSIYFQVLGEQGFIGLALYLLLLLASFVRCSRIISATRADPAQQWIADLARAIQTSLAVFCIAAAALSMAYYDLFIICVALLLPLRDIHVKMTALGTAATPRFSNQFVSSAGKTA
jgi:putative inorganic carbon (HCO3(-)) transporter